MNALIVIELKKLIEDMQKANKEQLFRDDLGKNSIRKDVEPQFTDVESKLTILLKCKKNLPELLVSDVLSSTTKFLGIL